jgi:hypothetical protein
MGFAKRNPSYGLDLLKLTVGIPGAKTTAVFFAIIGLVVTTVEALIVAIICSSPKGRLN